MNNISRRRVYWHTPAASLSCINGKQAEVELLLISVYVFRSRARAASMCVHALASVHNAGSRRACKCQQWDSHAWFKIYTCVCVRAYVCIQYVFACSCVYVCFYACACVLCVHYVHSLLWQYPNLERKCIFEQRTLTRWPAQVNLCVCNSEKCVCVTLGDKVNGVFFSDATDSYGYMNHREEMDFIFFALRVREQKRSVARNSPSFHNIVWKRFYLLCKHESCRNK